MMVLSAGSWVCAVPRAEAKYTGKIQPIEADDEVRLFDQLPSRLCSDASRARPNAGDAVVGKAAASLLLVRHRGADRLGKMHATIPIRLFARDSAH